jgi:hypothetical protein
MHLKVLKHSYILLVFISTIWLISTCCADDNKNIAYQKQLLLSVAYNDTHHQHRYHHHPHRTSSKDGWKHLYLQHSIVNVDSTTQEGIALVVFSIFGNVLLWTWGCCSCGGTQQQQRNRHATIGKIEACCPAEVVAEEQQERHDSDEEINHCIHQMHRNEQDVSSADALMMQFIYGMGGRTMPTAAAAAVSEGEKRQRALGNWQIGMYKTIKGRCTGHQYDQPNMQDDNDDALARQKVLPPSVTIAGFFNRV